MEIVWKVWHRGPAIEKRCNMKGSEIPADHPALALGLKALKTSNE
jgi:hypothetical protein